MDKLLKNYADMGQLQFVHLQLNYNYIVLGHLQLEFRSHFSQIRINYICYNYNYASPWLL